MSVLSLCRSFLMALVAVTACCFFGSTSARAEGWREHRYFHRHAERPPQLRWRAVFRRPPPVYVVRPAPPPQVVFLPPPARTVVYAAPAPPVVYAPPQTVVWASPAPVVAAHAEPDITVRSLPLRPAISAPAFPPAGADASALPADFSAAALP